MVKMHCYCTDKVYQNALLTQMVINYDYINKKQPEVKNQVVFSNSSNASINYKADYFDIVTLNITLYSGKWTCTVVLC